MKLNLDFYRKELDLKEIPEEYEEVLEKVNSVNDNFSSTLNIKSKIKNILALSEIRENILNWYDIKPNSTILELNANYGEITGLLCKKANKVIAVEKSLKFSKIIEKRYANEENLELIVGNLDNIEIKEKFDYIVIVGIAKELEKYVEYAKKHLKDDGIILIAVNNKFGVKSWISLKEENKVIDNDYVAISKNKIDKILNGLNTRYYYPLPDYKLPNIIYTSKYIPSLADIDRDLTYKDEDVNFKEVDALREIIKDEPTKFFDFANSFFIEVSRNELIENNIKFITFSNIRKDKYRIKTIIKDNEVYKTNVNDKSKDHIENIKKNIDILNELDIKTLDSYDDEKIISKYCTSSTLDKILIEIYKDEKIDGFVEKVKEYENFLKEKLQVIDYTEENIFKKYNIQDKYENEEKNEISKLTFVKYGFWDLIFQNCFVKDNQYYFYDQEWLENNVPVEYIIYRAIRYFNEIKNYVSEKDILDKLGYTEYIAIFEKLDNAIQEKIRKDLFWHIHTKEELISKKNQQVKELKNQLDFYKNECENLSKIYIEKNNEIAILQNSFSWKITRPLRKIRGFAKKNERK